VLNVTDWLIDWLVDWLIDKIDKIVTMNSDAGWGAESADQSGYGKAPAPSRGGLTNYRTRPY